MMAKRIVGEGRTMRDLQGEISQWAESTFDHDERGIITHLIREAVELAFAAGMKPGEVSSICGNAVKKEEEKGKMRTIPEEGADVGILLLSLAGYVGFDLEEYILRKHVINIFRAWGPRDEEGISEHLPDGADQYLPLKPSPEERRDQAEKLGDGRVLSDETISRLEHIFLTRNLPIPSLRRMILDLLATIQEYRVLIRSMAAQIDLQREALQEKEKGVMIEVREKALNAARAVCWNVMIQENTRKEYRLSTGEDTFLLVLERDIRALEKALDEVGMERHREIVAEHEDRRRGKEEGLSRSEQSGE
jgi:hypothetical protein